MKPQPMQPIAWDGKGVIRFQGNAIVRALLDYAQERGFGLNQICGMPFRREDRDQFHQLIGYSVSGFGDLNPLPATLKQANRIAAKVAKTRERKARKSAALLAGGK